MNNAKFLALFLVAAFVTSAAANCGCLKCSKHLNVISPPGAPCKIILRGPPCSAPGQPLPYQLQVPLLPPPPPCGTKAYGYRIEAAALKPQPAPEYLGPMGVYEYQLQVPLIPPPPPCQPKVLGVSFAPDRIVLPAPDCSSYQPPRYYQQPPQPMPMPPPMYAAPVPSPMCGAPAPSYGPILQPLPANFFKKCGCRYSSRTKRSTRSIPNPKSTRSTVRRARTKREMPLLQTSVKFLMGLLPSFIKLPIQHTLKTLRNHHKLVTKHDDMLHKFKPMRPFFDPRSNLKKPSLVQSPRHVQNALATRGSLLQKLHQLNQEPVARHKRAAFFEGDSQEMVLPFFRVTDVESEDDSSEDDSFEEASAEDFDNGVDLREEYLRPLNFNHMIPHNPIYYLLNTPIRLLHHFHRLGEQISPVFKSMPQVFVSSKKYLRDFGKHLKNDVLNFASNFIGDFDDFSPQRTLLHARHRRSVVENQTEPYEPDYSLVFQDHARTKRYILKVVDEDEVQEFLKEKLGGLVEPPEVVKPETRHKPKKRLVVEKLKSKIIIDNKGRPFLEINGVKRPLFLKRKEKEEKSKDAVEAEVVEKKAEAEEKKAPEPKEEDITDKINSLIEKARSSAPIVGQPQSQEVPLQIVKDKIKQILDEIQGLIDMDTSAYWKIHNDLYKLQHFKDFLVEDWKKILIEAKYTEAQSQIRILDDFKEMQALKDDVVKDISTALSNGNSFMTKKLIKMLVRLQKLQCVIYRIVEDFGEAIKMGTSLDPKKEIKYIDFLSELRFVLGQNQHGLENELKDERDAALESEMKLLSNLKRMLESGQSDKMFEEAKLLWEIKNVEKLQKDAIKEIEVKLGQGQKIRKELKILFDLLRQLENCEEKQSKLFGNHHHEQHDYFYEKKPDRHDQSQYEQNDRYDQNDRLEQSERYDQIDRSLDHSHVQNDHDRGRDSGRHYDQMVGSYHNQRNDHEQKHGHKRRHHRNPPVFKFPPSSRTIIEDKKPVKLITNGYTLTGYKVTDDF